MDAPVGISVAAVTEWMVREVGATAPLRFTLIAGGRSNLTYRVDDAAGRAFALRRPPVAHVLPTAHDMVREHTIISALHPAGVPVAQPLGLCRDTDVNDAPFYVMEFVEGAILRNEAQAEAWATPEVRHHVGTALATTLAQLHAVDVNAIGLGDLARHDGYIERQVKRWMGQYEQMKVDGVDHGGLVEAVGASLAANVPTQQKVSVVHGDYRLDNTVLSPTGDVRAILDWEICTLGDPMADLGVLLCYWSERGDGGGALLDAAPTMATGFSTRDEVLHAYAAATDLDVSSWAYYQAFGYWKLACILQGVYFRYLAGAGGGDQGDISTFPAHINSLAQRATTILGN